MRYTEAEWLGLYVNAIANAPLFVGVALVFSFALSVNGETTNAILFLGSNIVLMLIVGALKITTHVGRPKNRLIDAPLQAFPSGHAAASMFLTFTIPYFTFPKSISIALTLLVIGIIATFLVAMSRLVLNVHTRLQVMAGLLLGVLVPAIMVLYHDELTQMLHFSQKAFLGY